MVNSRENRQINGSSVILHGTITGWPPRSDALSVGGVQRRVQCTALPIEIFVFLKEKSIFDTVIFLSTNIAGIGPLLEHFACPSHFTAGANWKTRLGPRSYKSHVCQRCDLSWHSAAVRNRH